MFQNISVGNVEVHLKKLQIESNIITNQFIVDQYVFNNSKYKFIGMKKHKDKFHAHFVLQDNIQFSIFFEKFKLGKMIEIKKARDDYSNIINVY